MVYNGKKWYKSIWGRKIIKKYKIKVEKTIKVVYNVCSTRGFIKMNRYFVVGGCYLVFIGTGCKSNDNEETVNNVLEKLLEV